jgi:FkbM family methyltransferase
MNINQYPDLASYRRALEANPESFSPQHEYHNETLNDRWIAEYIFPGKRSGYFVEAGAANGKDASSCYTLETDLGWLGIAIEPNPDFFTQVQQNRPHSHCANICLSDKAETVTFIFADEDPLIAPYISGVKSNLEQYKWEGEKVIATGNPVEMSAVPLVDLLRQYNAPKVIDFAAFDIEGSEFKVLESFPFNEYCFLALSVEADEWIWEKLLEILKPHGYHEVENPFNRDRIWEKYCIHASILPGF